MTMYIVSVVNYALPCMLAETALKDAHNAALDGDLVKAMDYTIQAIAESKIMLNSLIIMKEKEDAGRSVT